MKKLPQSASLFAKALQYIPGGVNSPVRAFGAVGGTPVFIKKAAGAYLYDEDDNRYIDLVGSWGPMLLGHAHPLIEEAVRKSLENSLSFGAPTSKEVEMAELIVEMVPSIEKVRMVNSGTEATMSAIRLARGYTGRDKIIKLEGCYHGHGDAFLIAAGSGAASFGTPNSPGVTEGTAKDTLSAPYNDLESIENLCLLHKNEIAALILEPVAGNMGCVLPQKGYLEGLRKLCDRENIVLIFDEVMTGFRLAAGGAQSLFGVTPDLTTLGKIIGGGMPVGAYGGKKEIMSCVSPEGKVYQAGTLSGNPVAMSAGIAILSYLQKHPETYTQLDKKGELLQKGLQKNLDNLGLQYTINRIGSMIAMFFSAQPVHNFADAQTADVEKFKVYFHEMLRQNIYTAPMQYESLFLSTALTDKDLQEIIAAHYNALKITEKQ